MWLVGSIWSTPTVPEAPPLPSLLSLRLPPRATDPGPTGPTGPPAVSTSLTKIQGLARQLPKDGDFELIPINEFCLTAIREARQKLKPPPTPPPRPKDEHLVRLHGTIKHLKKVQTKPRQVHFKTDDPVLEELLASTRRYPAATSVKVKI